MEYKQKEKIINDFYEKGLPLLVSFEPERKRRLYKMVIIESILITVCLLYYNNYQFIEQFFLKTSSQGWLSASMYAIVACTFAVLIYPYIVHSGFQEDIKTEIMPKIIKSLGGIKHATMKDVFSQKELLNSTLFSRFNTMESDDSFCGTFDGISCKILETELIWQGNKHRSTSFKGVIISFNSNKKTNAKTSITTANDTAVGNKIPLKIKVYMFMPVIVILSPLLVNFIKNYDSLSLAYFLLALPVFLIPVIIILTIFSIVNRIQSTKYNVNKKQIKLEDPKFAKRFRVYSEDEIEARYLITPSFMERLLNLATSFGTNKIKCAFYDNKVMFAISTRKNLFEFGSLFKRLDNPKNIGFFNELFSILDMIAYFKLDEKTKL